MKIRNHLSTIVVAVVAASVAAGAPAIAHGVQHALFAHNADKVDGKHAVGAGATVTQRRGRLVATNGTTGRLPNNIIAKAPDANMLDGLDSSSFMQSEQVYLVDTFTNLFADQAVTRTALCAAGDIVLGGSAWGQGLNFTSEGLYQEHGQFAAGAQGWRATATATSGPGSHFIVVDAICYDVVT